MEFPVTYSPIIDRPPLAWPDGARIAVQVVMNIEYFETGKPATSVNPGRAALQPDVYNHSWRDYGLRAGIWRQMRLFDKYGIRPSVALNALVCKHYPRVIEEMLKRKWELMGHGLTNSQVLTDLPVEQERQVIADTLRIIGEASGSRPRGWLGPALGESWDTLRLLEEAGVDYVCDWINDDEPYRFDTPQKRLISMPYSGEINDIHCFLRAGYDAAGYKQLLIDQFDALYEEGAERAKVMTIPMHPFITGHPFRARHLDAAFAHMAGKAGVWFATGSEIADAYAAQAR